MCVCSDSCVVCVFRQLCCVCLDSCVVCVQTAVLCMFRQLCGVCPDSCVVCVQTTVWCVFRQLKTAPEQKVSQLTIKLRNVMMQLRKCCSHPFLLEHPLDPKTGELSLDERIVSQSGKMLVLDRMLKELQRRQHKVERTMFALL